MPTLYLFNLFVVIKVIVVEDTSTTGGSPLKAIEAVEKAGATVVAVAVVVDRDTGAKQVIEIFRDEITRTLQQLGCLRFEDLDSSWLASSEG